MNRFARMGLAALLLPGLPAALTAQDAGEAADTPLAITGARILDVRTGSVLEARTLVVSGGRIQQVLASDEALPPEARILDAAGGLVTPGLVEVHGHLGYVLGDSVSAGGGYITHLTSLPDSLAAYRNRYAAAYLPQGVTTVRDVGSTEADLELLAGWSGSAPDLPDFLPSGGALVSPEEGRATFPGHVVVDGPDNARAKVREYHRLGFRHVKLYWRLREPEFLAALEEARRLDMRVTGHVDFHVLGFQRALDLGLRSFEHAYTVGVGAMTDREYQRLWAEHVPATYGTRRNGLFPLAMTEVYNQLGPANHEALALIQQLADTGSTVSTSLHIFAQAVGAAPFRIATGTGFDDISGLTDAQQARAGEGYEIMADYVRRMHEAGVRLTLAADWLEPGRVALSEIFLLGQAGIPMADALRIATLNGAQALGLDDRGAVEPGMKADLVIFQRDPLEDPEGLFGEKTVLKGGRVVHQP